LPTGEAVNQLLDACDGRVELNIDFGNFKRDKYANLQACAPYTVSSHAKGEFTAALALDGDDYARCLDTLHAADYDGPYFLILRRPTQRRRVGRARGRPRGCDLIALILGKPIHENN
jgi:hypothetical protein